MKKWGSWYVGFTVVWVSAILLWQLDWSNKDAPAWVQAVGSILAIIGAGGIAHWQLAVARRDARNGPLHSLRAIMDRANFMIDCAPDTVNNSPMVIQGFAVTLSHQKFRDVADALNEYPISSVQDYNAIEAIFEMRAVLARMCSIVAPIDAIEANYQREQEIIELLYDLELCKENAARSMVYLRTALHGAGIE